MWLVNISIYLLSIFNLIIYMPGWHPIHWGITETRHQHTYNHIHSLTSLLLGLWVWGRGLILILLCKVSAQCRLDLSTSGSDSNTNSTLMHNTYYPPEPITAAWIRCVEIPIEAVQAASVMHSQLFPINLYQCTTTLPCSTDTYLEGYQDSCMTKLIFWILSPLWKQDNASGFFFLCVTLGYVLDFKNNK